MIGSLVYLITKNPCVSVMTDNYTAMRMVRKEGWFFAKPKRQGSPISLVRMDVRLK